MKDDRLYLHHILDRRRRITRFIQPGQETFMVFDQLQDAVIRNVASCWKPELQAVLEQFLAAEDASSMPSQ